MIQKIENLRYDSKLFQFAELAEILDKSYSIYAELASIDELPDKYILMVKDFVEFIAHKMTEFDFSPVNR